MSGNSYVVMGVGPDSARSRLETAKVASAIQQTMHQESHRHADQMMMEKHGPVKEILDHPDSLYRYINWEDPFRTITSYLTLTILLSAIHFLPLTRWILKIGAITFGAISLAEFTSRSFGPSTFLSRLRPQPHKTLPEDILNATLKDIHDLIQFSVIQAQRILFGQDLNKTFGAFVSFTAMFWLAKVVSPFSMALLGVTGVWVAPLVASGSVKRVVGEEVSNGKAVLGDMADGVAHVGNGHATAQARTGVDIQNVTGSSQRGHAVFHHDGSASPGSHNGHAVGHNGSTSNIGNGNLKPALVFNTDGAPRSPKRRDTAPGDKTPGNKSRRGSNTYATVERSPTLNVPVPRTRTMDSHEFSPRPSGGLRA